MIGRFDRARDDTGRVGRLHQRPSARPSASGRSIGGVFDWGPIDAEAWRRRAAEDGVDESAVLDRVHRMTANAPAAFTAALDDVEDRDGSVADVRARFLPTHESRPT